MRKLITFAFLIAAVIAQTPDEDDEYKLPGGLCFLSFISNNLNLNLKYNIHIGYHI